MVTFFDNYDINFVKRVRNNRGFLINFEGNSVLEQQESWLYKKHIIQYFL